MNGVCSDVATFNLRNIILANETFKLPTVEESHTHSSPITLTKVREDNSTVYQEIMDCGPSKETTVEYGEGSHHLDSIFISRQTADCEQNNICSSEPASHELVDNSSYSLNPGASPRVITIAEPAPVAQFIANSDVSANVVFEHVNDPNANDTIF